MVGTWERNKETHPGQPLAPKACKSKEQAAAERAEKAIASQKKAEERLDRITGLASLEQQIMDESQQSLTHAARPVPSQARKISRTFSVHNIQSLQDAQDAQALPGARY